MSSSISDHGRSPVGIQRGKMVITDIESLKKTEISRRRKLRLEQVRQQSKDIANHIRQRVRGEQDKQTSAFEQQQNAEIQRLQARKLFLLQQQYQECLDEVGLGHMQAALQPDAGAVLEAGRKRNQAQADDRGREANVKLRLELADTERRRSASRKQHKFTRTIEDLRSAVVASLVKKSPKQTPKKRHWKKRQPLRDASRSPNCTCGCAVCICSSAQTETARTEWIPPVPVHSPSKHGADTDITSSDMSDTSTERSCIDESRVQRVPTSSTSTSSSKKVDQSKVQYYDHGNRFASVYPYQARVERVFPHAYERDAIEAAELQSETVPASNKTSSHWQARGQQALVRERLHRDYRQLLSDLHALARKERLIRSTHVHSLPTEIFLEDYRHKELCTKRQRNMDSAFESVYHGVQQDSCSRPSSAAEAVSLLHWETAEQDSPIRLNVADFQLRQNGCSPVNNFNAVASNRDSADIQHTVARTVYSEKKASMLEDLVERINIQRSLLRDKMNMPQERLPIPQKHMIPVSGISDQSPANGGSSVALSSLHEDEHEVHAEEKKNAVDHEKHCEQETKEHRSLDDDKRRENQVTSSGRRDTVDHKEEECGKHGVHTANRESDTISKKTCDKWYGKNSKEKTENENDKSENLVSLLDKGDRRGDTEVVRDNDSVTVLSEYSFDVSVSKTREHSVESSMGNSSSTSYEGVKIVVSVSELTEKKFKSGSSPEKSEAILCKGSPQKVKRYDVVGRKICRRKHKRLDRDGKDVREKATMTTESELKGPSKREPDMMAGKGETERSKGKDKDRIEMWHHMINRNVISDKDLSEASTSYMSPPDQLASSHIQDLGKLLATVHDYQKKRDPDIREIDPRLALYISQLLSMSRESVEYLDVSTSDMSTPDVETSAVEGIYSKRPCEVTKHIAKEQTKKSETTEKQTYTNLKAKDAIKEITNTMKKKTKAMTVSHLEHESVTCTRQVVSQCCVQTQSTTTPHGIMNGELPHEHVLRERPFLQEQLHSSCRHDENSYEFDIKTPPFPSVIADMSLDEYKTLKFPEIFSDYSEKCSERISNLAKKIEQIRGEKRKLIESSGSGSSASSSSNEGQGLDSTKYLSPPESSVVMTHILSKDKGHITPSHKMKFSDQEMAVPISACDVGSPNAAQGSSFSKPSDESKTSLQQQHPSQGKCPPLCLWSQKLQSGVDTQQIKELSTIIEGDSAQSSYCLPSHITKQEESVAREKSENSTSQGNESQVWGDKDIPDVMTEMLRRGLITSPLAWTKVVQQSEDDTSVSEVSVSHSGATRGSHDAESRKFAASPPEHVEHEEFKQAILESYVGKGTGTTQSFRDRQSIADKKMEFSQQVAETFAKLGKNPSRTDVKNAFKNLGFKWKVRERDQPVNSVISKYLDPASEEFRQQVLESFVGLGFDSSPEDLEAAFRRLGLDCPGGSLCRSDVNEPKQTHTTPEPDSYDLCSSVSTALPSYSACSDDDLST